MASSVPHTDPSASLSRPGSSPSRKRKAEDAVLADNGSADSAALMTSLALDKDKFSSKGLRHFSMRLCKKVEEKVMTTFNEVADEIVAEFALEGGIGPDGKPRPPSKSHSEKNIRRRVYDALNVLMAMDVITKVKKQITWNGLPSNTRRDLDMTDRQIEERKQVIAEKRQHLEELLVQSIAYHNVVRKNRSVKRPVLKQEKIPIPFVIVNTDCKTKVELEISENRSDVFFKFNDAFEIHDYSEVLLRMGMHKMGTGGAAAAAASKAGASTAPTMEARKKLLEGIVPEHLVEYVPESVFTNQT